MSTRQRIKIQAPYLCQVRSTSSFRKFGSGIRLHRLHKLTAYSVSFQDSAVNDEELDHHQYARSSTVLGKDDEPFALAQNEPAGCSLV